MKIGIFGFSCDIKTSLLSALACAYPHEDFVNLEMSNLDSLSILDAYFYLDTPSNIFAKTSNLEEQEITTNKIAEIAQLSEIAKEFSKEVVIFDEDIEMCVQFMQFYLELFAQNKCNPDDVARHLISEIPKDLLSKKNVLVVDCDRTVSINDVSATFLQALSIDTSLIGAVFGKTRYSMYQFYKIMELYRHFDKETLEKAILEAYSNSTLKDEVVGILQNNQNALCIGLSAGALMAWQYIAKKDLPLHALFGNIYERGYLVTPSVKEAVVKVLQEMDKNVIAIGDSIIDIPMLEMANKGYLVSYSFIGKGVEHYLQKQAKPKIKQLSFTKFPYDNVEIEDFSF